MSPKTPTPPGENRGAPNEAADIVSNVVDEREVIALIERAPMLLGVRIGDALADDRLTPDVLADIDAYISLGATLFDDDAWEAIDFTVSGPVESWPLRIQVATACLRRGESITDTLDAVDLLPPWWLDVNDGVTPDDVRDFRNLRIGQGFGCMSQALHLIERRVDFDGHRSVFAALNAVDPVYGEAAAVLASDALDKGASAFDVIEQIGRVFRCVDAVLDAVNAQALADGLGVEGVEASTGRPYGTTS